MEDILPYIPYNSSNKNRAKEMRKIMTKAEQMAWEVLRKKKLWYVFLRQKMIDSFIIDFYCSKLLLGLEIDWGIHTTRIQYDMERDTKLYKKWIKIIRCTNEYIYNDIDWWEEEIKKEIKIREKERAWLLTNPS